METNNQVASSSDAGRSTSLIAGKSETTTGSKRPYSPKNKRVHGYKKIPWKNGVTQIGDQVRVDVFHAGQLCGTVLLDTKDIDKVRYPLRIDKDGYAYSRGSPSKFVSHIVADFNYTPGCGLVVDHINRNKLDNRRENLRVTTIRGNNLNHPAHASNSTGVRGVNRDCYTDKDGKTHYMSYEAIIVNPRDPLTGPHHKAHQYRKRFYFGMKTGVSEEDAKAAAISWLNQKRKEFDRENISCLGGVCSTTIPGVGVGSK